MKRQGLSKTWIYPLFWLILLSRSSAYFGLTGKAQIRNVEGIDQEAAYMSADEQDSVYVWNENGYYTAPSNGYERIDLSPQPDSEVKTRGLRSKMNAAPRKTEVGDDLLRDNTMQRRPVSRPSIRSAPMHPRAARIPGRLQYVRPNQFTRRHAGPYPNYYRRLTRVPRYHRPPIQEIRYPHDIRRFGGENGRAVPPIYDSQFPNGRQQPYSPYGGPTPEQAISRPVGSVNINRMLARKNHHQLGTNANTRKATATPPFQADGRKTTRDILDGFSSQDDQPSQREDSDTKHTPQSSRTGKPDESREIIKPLFVTKDIPSIMKFMGVDEKGNAYVAMDEDVDPSSLSSPIMSEAGSRATDLPPMVPSSDINKKNARKECDELKLTRKQRKMCKKDPGLPQVLREATATSVAECQYQFRFERWNCSTGTTRIHLLSKGNRETAFLFAISSAGLTHSVARACAEGHLERCYCDETYSDPVNQEAWMWGGCGDNVHSAAKFVRQFLKPKSRSRDIRAEVDKHNSDLGIRLVRQSVQKTCKCHGVSGSCTTKTCWRKVAPFYEIGEKIKSAYNRSVKVGGINSSDGRPQLIRLRRMRRNRPELRPTLSSTENDTTSYTVSSSPPISSSRREYPAYLGNTSRSARQRLRVEPKRPDANPRSNELVYLENSPQYCRRTRYSLGTKGRLCDKDRNCDQICCGRGYTTEIRIVRRSCECEVRWCCYVECKTCTEERKIHTCK